MEIKFEDNKVILNKKLNSLDLFVIDFCNILNNLDISYVLISGYVAILFGRSRSSEDIDIFIEKTNKDKFSKLWSELYKKFECINTDNLDEAYNDYLNDNVNIRFSYKSEFIPNMEVKFPKLELDFWVLENKKEVILNKEKMYISPIELQISFKLLLGSEKDLEDAKYIYNIFNDNINVKLLDYFNQKFKVVEKYNKYIK